jgi:uncharacterized membrane protein YfcA
MSLVTHIDPLFVLSGFCVGILVGLTGVGGGSLMTPVLILLFGVHPTTAVGTDLLFAASTKTAGVIMHERSETIDWRLVGLLALGSVPATIATLMMLAILGRRDAAIGYMLTLALGIVILLTAAFLFLARRFRFLYADRLGKLDPRIIRLLTVLLGAAMGCLVSSTSVGAGAIGVTMIVLLYPRMPVAKIVGSDIAHAVPLTLIAGGGHWYLGSTDWQLLGTLLVGSMPGIILGSYLTGSIPETPIRWSLACVLVIVGTKLLMT